MERAKILLVEDDTSLGYLLSEYLKMKNFHMTWVKNGVEALQMFEKNMFDLAILDVMMPEMDGFTLAEKMKSKYPEVPFIFLTARSLKIDVLKGFALGAIDYLKKPIDEEELVVRIENLLSRIKVTEGTVVSKEVHRTLGDYEWNTETQELRFKGEVIQLTGRENELLLFLVSHQGELCSHKDILNALWGKNDYFNRKSLNVFVSHLRKYLSKDPAIKIENIHNQGFLIKVEK